MLSTIVAVVCAMVAYELVKYGLKWAWKTAHCKVAMWASEYLAKHQPAKEVRPA